MTALPFPAPAAEPAEPVDAASSLEPQNRAQRLGFYFYALHLWTIFGIALSNGLLGLAVLAAPAAARGRLAEWRRFPPILLPLAAYYLLLVGSVIDSADRRESAGRLGEIFSLATLFLCPFLLSGERAARRVVTGLIAVAAAIAAYGLAQFFFGWGDIENRIRGPFSHYMTFSGILLICDLLLIARLCCGREHRHRWSWAALVLINGALLGSLTRGPWVALVATLCLLLLLLRRPRFLLAAAPALVLFILLAPVQLVQRAVSIFDLRDTSNYDRLCMLDAGLRMVADRPWFGVGADMVRARYPIYRQPTAPRFWVPHLHNSFIELAAERGLPALAAYLWMLAAGLRRAWRGYRLGGGRRGARGDLYLGVVLALVAFNLAGLFEANWRDAEVQRLALFLLALPFCFGDDYASGAARTLAP